MVDFTQNFWESRRQLQEMVREDVFDDDMLDSEGDVSTCPPNCEINDYAELLKNCTEFDFQLVTPGQERIVDQAQKIYDGESGLRRGVAYSFHSPFQAFQRCGFTPQLVAHYTVNSNR